uniref:3-phenylpropionate/trans-cinnamate dioxygenase ferredoxin subunit n=1 Tax=Candidatus Kentrum sp. SD TaxID=2126332 RepID=A0A450Z7L6_9GAMM|nr:MAG: 3-phenylpropionate/trans-cinnamate dioxygenase ferredoxin subunit [Candidatus Kentron sp. SD]VFK49769.1 MAG: 3-phenylpropionate/trans-cinnamate dioxygenase ferredoxin subunit [Candidatus Kentron sp. SD]VFK81014.1 MAG: 3-phenylpropionate/trans-cinnamate dioxygenase ferredoxin subunit [Candidatus Kentron sp. SD]
MTNWIDVASVGEFKRSTCRSIMTVDGTEIAVFNLNDEFYAVEDACPHDYKPLSGGGIDGDQLICPWHGARFDIKTGDALSAPAHEALVTFPTRVEKGMVQVEWIDDE